MKLQNSQLALLKENAELRISMDPSLDRNEVRELMQRVAGKHQVGLRLPPVFCRRLNGPNFMSGLGAASGKEVLGPTE